MVMSPSSHVLWLISERDYDPQDTGALASESLACSATPKIDHPGLRDPWNPIVMPTGAATECLYLIDAHSLIFQVFHAIPEMSSPSGLPTNALFGFTRDMLFLRQEKKPDYLLCAFDVGDRTFRNQLFAEYKANRSPMPEDLRPQLPLIVRM